MLAAVTEAEEALKEGATEPSGPIATAPVQFGQMYVAPAVARYAQCHPQVTLRVLFYDRVVNLLDEGVDLGCAWALMTPAWLHNAGRDAPALLRAPACSRRAGQHPDDLRGALRALHRRSELSGVCHRWPQRAGAVAGNLEFNHIAPAIDACVAGARFGLFLCYRCGRISNAVRIVLRDFEPPPRPSASSIRMDGCCPPHAVVDCLVEARVGWLVCRAVKLEIGVRVTLPASKRFVARIMPGQCYLTPISPSPKPWRTTVRRSSTTLNAAPSAARFPPRASVSRA